MLILVAAAIGASDARALDLLGVRAGNELVTFDSDAPGVTRTLGGVTGLQGGEQLIAIDMHPDTGELYGVTDAARLYRINPRTRAATQVGAPLAITTASGVGVSFDPQSWRLIVITGAGQQLGVDAQTGAVLETSMLPTTGIVAVAHRFSTTYYGLNATDDTLVLINLTPTPSPIGPLGFDTESTASLDIATNGGEAYAVLDAPGATASTLARINVGTGAAGVVGTIGGGKILAFTVWTRRYLVRALTSDGRIVSFFSSDPGTLLTDSPVLGLPAGETLVGFDNSNAATYAVSKTGRLYVLNNETATLIGPATPQPWVNGTSFDVDFNAPLGRMRVVSNLGNNVTLDPETGAATVRSVGGGMVGVASRYREGAGAPTSTTTFGIDTSADYLVRIGAADGEATPGGAVTPIGTLGVDVFAEAGFEIVQEDGTALAAIANQSGTSSTLMVLSLASGRATPIGVIGGGAAILDLAVWENPDPLGPRSISFASATVSVNESAEIATVTVQRTGSLVGPLWVEYWGFPASASASDGTDFLMQLRRVTIPDGQDHAVADVLVINDGDDEPDETFDIYLLGASLGVSTGSGIHQTTVTIVDDDPPAADVAPRVTITSQFGLPMFSEQRSFTDIEGTATTTSPSQSIASLTWKSNRGFSGTLPNTSPWRISNVPLQAGTNIITVYMETSDGAVATDVVNIGLASLIYSLAEGATGSFFRTDIAIANPNAEPAPFDLTLLREDGSKLVQQHVAPALSRQTIKLNDIAELGETAVSTVVTSTAAKPLIVERTMRWGDGDYGAHTEKANVDTSFNWYFAEGSQGFFDTYLLLSNPHTVPLNVTVAFLREGVPPFSVGLTLQPTSRKTIAAGDYPELVGRSFGIWVMFGSLGGTAERAMYFGRPPEPLWKAGHESAGVSQLSRTWFLAEGATGPFFETFLLFANPSQAPATATLTFLPDQGSPVTRQIGIPANGRATVNLEALDPPAPELANAAVATQVESTQPIVVERAQYWPGPPDQWYEAHNSFGIVATHTKWGLAEGRVGNPPGESGREYQTYILLANPTSSQAHVTIEFLRQDNTAIGQAYVVEPNSRRNVRIAGPESDFPGLANEHFGAIITSDQPIAVERAMYSNANGQVFAAGTNATATRLP